MTYGEIKEMDVYKNANDIDVCVNGEEPIEEMYYPEELDDILVIGTGSDGNNLLIDLVCENWKDRHKIGWVAQ